MRLVAVSIVKNEADIIESFVRHTLAWVDHHLVFDHDSTDGTREILGALQREGLPLTLHTDDALGNLQQARSNFLVRLAAREHAADWIIPLDADEILCGPNRAVLEGELTASTPRTPRSLPLVDYVATENDNPAEPNPVLRVQHRAPGPRHTRKVMIPQALARDETIAPGKGSHAIYQGDTVLPDQPLPAAFHLAHFPLRSPQHQALRIVLAELQKLSRGQAAAGVDVHYRLGFQLLAENPDLFFATATGKAEASQQQPAPYLGGALRYSEGTAGWNRVVRALLPYLEKLAASHGRLVDGGRDEAGPSATPVIRELAGSALPPPGGADTPAFSGFVAFEGLGPREGPVAAAFLPPFHWGYAPLTRLLVETGSAHHAIFSAEVLTYSDDQTITLELNGAEVGRLHLPRLNQKERWTAPLPLRAGRNEVVLRYTRSLVTAHDPRQLAAIFLSLRILPPS